MKKLIRKYVFETNSSSTHSLTLSILEDGEAVTEGATFEIRSPFAKLLQMLGLIDNAESNLRASATWIEEEDGFSSVREKLINTARLQNPSLLQDFDCTNADAYDLLLLCERLPHPEALDYSFFPKGNFAFYSFFSLQAATRRSVLRFREFLLAEYAAMTDSTVNEVLSKVEACAFGDEELHKILYSDVENTQETTRKLREYSKNNADFRFAFKQSKTADLLAFAKSYYVRDLEENKKLMHGKISCERYFDEGCLTDCDCDFCGYTAIGAQLGLNGADEALLRSVAGDFLTCYKFVGKELYQGVMPLTNGDIY